MKKFIAFYAVLLLNLLFTLFCREIFATIQALSCGEKIIPKVHLWRKNDKHQVWLLPQIYCDPFLFGSTTIDAFVSISLKIYD